MVRVLASQVQYSQTRHHMGQVCRWFSPLLRGFFFGFSGFPPTSKFNISKFQFDREFEGLSVIDCYVLPSLNKIDIFIYLFKKIWIINLRPCQSVSLSNQI